MFIYLFTSGFLLTRKELPEISADHVQAKSCNLTFESVRQYDRAVVLVIDALRYDFAAFDSGDAPINTEARFYRNFFSSTRAFVNDSRGGFLFEFVADPPTTTMQRLKALTTGSLPTFIDAGANFATDRISTDSLLSQLQRHDRHAVLAGDDTWLALFPDSFVRSYPASSFDVRDLHTVDNVVAAALPTELARADWSLLVGHFLGVDHCGHRYGPAHTAMEAKLRELDSVVAAALQQIDARTLLVVLGDHGMTATGDHGGASAAECGTAGRSRITDPPSGSGCVASNRIVAAACGDAAVCAVATHAAAVRGAGRSCSHATALGTPIPFGSPGKPIRRSF